MPYLRVPRRAIQRLGPYPSLILIAVPLALVEPLKLAVIFIVGSGHWVTGAVAMVFAYVVSLFVTERLFAIVKPKLLTLPWFAAGWDWFVAVRRKTIRRLRALRPAAGAAAARSTGSARRVHRAPRLPRRRRAAAKR